MKPLPETERGLVEAITNSIRSVTKKIPLEDIDVSWASESYGSGIQSMVSVPGDQGNELLCLTDSRLFLMGETNVKSFSDLRKIFLWYWPNFLYPVYSLSFYWNEETWRAFIRVDSKEYDLIRSTPPI